MMKQWKNLPDNLYKWQIKTPICNLWALASEERLLSLSFLKDFSKIKAQIKNTSILQKTSSQIQEYFQGKRKNFDIATEIIATDFQKDILSHLKKIGYGEVVSYKKLAEKSGRTGKHSRAIGLTMNSNPIPIIFPCHRVVGSDGKLVGFGGGLPLKKKLLDLERNAS
jgi:methylated-DNA-[protein]-cysteine S-methyltransferase